MTSVGAGVGGSVAMGVGPGVGAGVDGHKAVLGKKLEITTCCVDFEGRKLFRRSPCHRSFFMLCNVSSAHTCYGTSPCSTSPCSTNLN